MKKLVTAVFQAGTGQAAALFFGAISVKLLAITAGPAGIGLFSLIRQIQQTLTAVASLGGQNAIVQGMTSQKSNLARHEYRHAAFLSIVVWCLLIAVITFVYAKDFSLYLLHNQQVTIVRWLIVSVVLGAFLIFFRALLNAQMSISAVTWVNVSSALAATVIALPAGLAYAEGYVNALVLILIGSLGLGLIVSIVLSNQSGALKGFWMTLLKCPDVKALHQFSVVAFPSLLISLVGLGSILLIRVVIANYHGISSAGHFDAAWSISVMYMSLFFASLQTYLLPTLSAGKIDSSMHSVLDNALRLSLIVLVPLITLLIVIKPLAVHVLYSGEFIEALEILRWTLFGDFIRLAAWVLALFMLARADMLAYSFHEFLWNLVFVLMSLWLVPKGVQWVGLAYVVAYLLYFSLLLYRAISHFKVKISPRIVKYWVAGFIIIAIATAVTWSDSSLVWWDFSIVFISIFFGWNLITYSEKKYIKKLFNLGVYN